MIQQFTDLKAYLCPVSCQGLKAMLHLQVPKLNQFVFGAEKTQQKKANAQSTHTDFFLNNNKQNKSQPPQHLILRNWQTKSSTSRYMFKTNPMT